MNTTVKLNISLQIKVEDRNAFHSLKSATTQTDLFLQVVAEYSDFFFLGGGVDFFCLG